MFFEFTVLLNYIWYWFITKRITDQIIPTMSQGFSQPHLLKQSNPLQMAVQNWIILFHFWLHNFQVKVSTRKGFPNTHVRLWLMFFFPAKRAIIEYLQIIKILTFGPKYRLPFLSSLKLPFSIYLCNVIFLLNEVCQVSNNINKIWRVWNSI